VSSYYYLIAQLPHLNYGQTGAMSSADFRALARTFLNGEDYRALEACAAGDGVEDNPFIARYRAWDRALRLNLAALRWQRQKREGVFPLEAPGDPQDAVQAARNALAMESPLEAELYLDKARWDAIESFVGLDYFNVNTVFAYLLKLLLLERRALLGAEEGFSQYERLYASIMEEHSGPGAGLIAGETK
jgi:hypothetical protein